MILKCFGIAKDIIGKEGLEIYDQRIHSVHDLRLYLSELYPGFKKMPHYMVAVNMEFAEDNHMVSEDDDIAIIPPVSGG